jgi:hypothetical protein
VSQIKYEIFPQAFGAHPTEIYNSLNGLIDWADLHIYTVEKCICKEKFCVFSGDALSRRNLMIAVEQFFMAEIFSVEKSVRCSLRSKHLRWT